MENKQKTGRDVSVGVLSQLILYLKSLQIDEKRILTSCGIDPDITKDPDNRLNYGDYMAIENAAAEAAADSCFGLHMGEFIEPGHYSIVGYIMMNSRILSEALIKTAKYHRILGNMIQSRAVPGLGTIKFHFGIPAKYHMNESWHCMDSAMTSVLSLCRKLTGKRINPVQAGFNRPRPKPPEEIHEYERVYQCPVLFGQKTNFIQFYMKDGDTPIMTPNAPLQRLFEDHAAAYLKKLDLTQDLAGMIKEQILENIGCKSIGINQIARQISKSPRALQLQLKEEGYTFSSLLQQTRKELACRYLEDAFSIEEIAYMLGYAQISVFTKAFRRWTGTSPREYRKSSQAY